MAKEKFVPYLEKKVFQQLIDIGFPESSIQSEVQIHQRYRADFIVYEESGKPFLVVEVKGEARFIPDPKDEIQLRFNPIVRQVQAYAKEINAPYYLVTNGDLSLWFTTDLSGWPKLIDQTIVTNKIGFETKVTKLSLNTLREIFIHLYNLGSKKHGVYKSEDYGVLILVKLINEQGDEPLNYFIEDQGYWEKVMSKVSKFGLTNIHFIKNNFYREALRELSHIRLTDANPLDLLLAIDREIINRFSYRPGMRIPRWLADFLVRLGKDEDTFRIVDLACGYGDLLAASKMNLFEYSSEQIVGFTRSTESALWTRIQQVILGENDPNIMVADVFNSRLINTIQPDLIITAPEFGMKYDQNSLDPEIFSIRTSTSEALYIELAIKWLKGKGRLVILIPENLLFAGGPNLRLRNYIIENAQIMAIISLGNSALKPVSNIKTNVLILNMQKPRKPYEVFLSQVEDFLGPDDFNSLNNAQLANVVNSFHAWENGHEIINSPQSWLIPIEDLDPENMSVAKYMPPELFGYKELTSPFPLVPLEMIAEKFILGKQIKLVDNGGVQVIGPAAIRAMKVDPNDIQTTIDELLPANSTIVKSGDIVLNNIGTHLGDAAVIEEHLEGCHVSQHVIVIRSPRYDVLPEYLAAVINSDFVKPEIIRQATGNIMPRITIGRLREILIPLPNVHEQELIVNSIRTAHEQLDSAREVFQKAETNFDETIRSLNVHGEE
jgi:hypothetical protein